MKFTNVPIMDTAAAGDDAAANYFAIHGCVTAITTRRSIRDDSRTKKNDRRKTVHELL